MQPLNTFSPAQRRALDLLHHYRWATQLVLSEKPYFAGEHKIPWHIVRKLLNQGVIQQRTIRPGEAFPNKTVNRSSLPIHIICLTKAMEKLYE